ncbi:hypothetical protein CkaCkLH20_01949 [Colletotrichum karsti]|uniref:54S ribosomal protein L20 n=1 Tax=Colletotrichum karsti TaxID=1095194 RepID=A0A9P6LQM8_9PEZI|nr:uncharacterized protein CkaCkLH20_01949 [Colletotrichum karsti]KAF9880907.1 hypothetical protein CkaCkLH20_01949 [Colletotrichum karsti]
MEARTLTRPLAGLLRQQITKTLVPRRGHKTTTRTKKALKIAPHPDFLPSAAGDTILVNPPSAAPSVLHTPFKFLPSTDPRRRANLSALFKSASATASKTTTETKLPPALNVPSRGSNPRYHLTKDDVAEIRRLRNEDPVTWSVTALARKFDCSEMFITICTPAPREHKERLAKKLDAVKERWGAIRTKAREDRARRKEMLFRGEL